MTENVPELAVNVLLPTMLIAFRVLNEYVTLPVRLNGPLLLVIEEPSRNTTPCPETTVPPPTPVKLTLPVAVKAPLICNPLANATPLLPVMVPVNAIEPVPAFK